MCWTLKIGTNTVFGTERLRQCCDNEWLLMANLLWLSLLEHKLAGFRGGNFVVLQRILPYSKERGK
jgi:hypothetical protein